MLLFPIDLASSLGVWKIMDLGNQEHMPILENVSMLLCERIRDDPIATFEAIIFLQ